MNASPSAVWPPTGIAAGLPSPIVGAIVGIRPEDNVCAGVTVAELRRAGTAEHPIASRMDVVLCGGLKCPLAAGMTDAELQACIDK